MLSAKRTFVHGEQQDVIRRNTSLALHRPEKTLMAGMHSEACDAGGQRLQRTARREDLRQVGFKPCRFFEFTGPTFAAVHGVACNELWALRGVDQIGRGTRRVTGGVQRKER